MASKEPSKETNANNEKEEESGEKEARPDMLTSDYYTIKNIPERFNHPGMLDLLACTTRAAVDDSSTRPCSQVH